MRSKARFLALGLAGAAAVVAAVAVPPLTAQAAEEPASLIEDFSYPGAAAIDDITLIKGDGRIMLADCDPANPALIRVESITQDFCFAVQGDTGWLSLRIEAVYLVGAGDQDVAVSVEGMSAPIEVPADTVRPIQAVDPSRRGIVVELRATPN